MKRKKFQTGWSITAVAWMIFLFSIPMLSVYGRAMQVWVRKIFTSAELAGIFVTVSMGLLLVFAFRIRRGKIPSRWLHTSWAALIFLIGPFLLPTVEERLHFIVFGCLGALSVRILGFTRGLLLSLSIGLLDEILQWWLPDRVGDWRDVCFNWLACFGGCLLVRLAWGRFETINYSD